MLYLDYSRQEGQWLPNEHGGRENLDAVRFLQELNATVYRRHPGVVMVAEESTAWPGVTRPTHLGGLGFGFKWNMGWMHDTLQYLSHEPVHRSYHHNEMTFSLVYAWSENFVLPLSHDEVVHGKGSLWGRMPGDDWNKAAGLRVAARPSCGRTRASSCCSWAASSARSTSGRRAVAGLASAGRAAARVASGRCCGRLNAVYREQPGAVQPATPAGRLLLDRRQRRGRQRAELPAPGAEGARVACVANFAGVRRTTTTASACRRSGLA